MFCSEAESISPLYYSSYFPGFPLLNIARVSFFVKRICCIAHFPLPRALLSSRKRRTHSSSPLSDVSQVVVNQPQGNPDISGRTTRSSSQLNIPLFKTKSGQRSFYYRTVTLWNALKPHFKLSESLTIFKRKMKSFL